ncbi:MAG: peptidylprolyl isomerase [Verrucomicrobiota bacterium]
MFALKTIVGVGLLLFTTLSALQAGPTVIISTSLGDITVELNEEKAPKTVANFLSYVKEGFYDNTVFHRVRKKFMIQGGGFWLEESGEIKQKETKDPVENESQNGLKNERGAIAMARLGDPHSATSQFFINDVTNEFLDPKKPTDWAYTVFGKVSGGMDVVDKIAAVDTESKILTTSYGPRPMEDVPSETVVIKSIKLTE